MDLMSVIGWVAGFALIYLGIIVGFDMKTFQISINLNAFMDGFVDIPSIIIVMGGVVVALMVAFPAKCFTKIPKHLKIMLFPTKYNPQEYISQIVEFAKESRINGLLALEDKLKDTKDVFLRNSLMLVVDSVEPEKVKALLETELDYLDERHSQDRAFYDKGSSYAPAFGMIGTLIGLINLLKNMTDPDALSSSMSVALVTTFYGTVLSNLIFSPISNKLRVRHEEEYLCKMIISEGVQAIQAGENPNFIAEKLNQLIPTSLAVKAEGEGGSGEGKKTKKPKKEKK